MGDTEKLRHLRQCVAQKTRSLLSKDSGSQRIRAGTGPLVGARKKAGIDPVDPQPQA